jgi:serine/threonine protein kinase
MMATMAVMTHPFVRVDRRGGVDTSLMRTRSTARKGTSTQTPMVFSQVPIPTGEKVPSLTDIQALGYKVKPYPGLVPGTSKLKTYRLFGLLGEGTFGVTFLAWDGTKPVAIKLIKPAGYDDKMFSDEFEMQDELKGLPHAVQLYKEIQDDVNGFVLEPSNGGELAEYMESKNGLREEEARPLFKQLVQGLQEIHGKGIAVRDLKPANMLLFRKGDTLMVKYSDFGESTRMTVDNAEARGTVAYLAPEAFTGKVFDLAKADIFSLGLVLYKMLTANKVLLPRKMEGDRPSPILGEDPDYLAFKKNHPGAFQLVSKMTSTEPAKRPTLAEILANKDWPL